MPALLIRQHVSNYAVWRQIFDDHAHARTANGCQGVHIYHTMDDPNDTIVVLIWDTLVRARLFAQSDDLHESLDRASADRPDILLLDDVPALA